MAAAGDAESPQMLPVNAATTLATIRRTTRAMERDPRPYFGMDEANLRSCLVAALRGRAIICARSNA